MTKELLYTDVAKAIAGAVPNSIAESTDKLTLVKRENLLDVARFLKDAPGLEFDFLVSISAVDFIDYFEIVYHLLSMKHNHSTVIKVRAYSRDYPAVSSVIGVWQGADFQEREIYDLMGVVFTQHPNLKRIMLWEGFEGYPLRRDYIVKTPS